MGTALIHNRVISNGGAIPDYTYTGLHELVDEGDGNWKIRFLSSGTLTLKSKAIVDIFVVGGGGGGGNAPSSSQGAGGGGGGYTSVKKAYELAKKTEYVVTVGAGGVPGGHGGWSLFSDIVSAECGYPGSGISGGNGGSGGGGGSVNSSSSGANGCNGGYNGSNGISGGTSSSYRNGTGQGTTTREFHETSGDLYSGGGGGSTFSSSYKAGAGGAGGGGNAWQSGVANTGGGGGGAPNQSQAGYGGAGIVIIRNTRG